MIYKSNYRPFSILKNKFKGHGGIISYSRQKKIQVATDSTLKIYEVAYYLFDNVWKGNPIRHLGVHITDFCGNDFYQCCVLDTFDYDKDSKLNKAVDEIRLKYGDKAIGRSCFLHSGLSAMCGGIGEEDYPLMSAML